MSNETNRTNAALLAEAYQILSKSDRKLGIGTLRVILAQIALLHKKDVDDVRAKYIESKLTNLSNYQVLYKVSAGVSDSITNQHDNHSLILMLLFKQVNVDDIIGTLKASFYSPVALKTFQSKAITRQDLDDYFDLLSCAADLICSSEDFAEAETVVSAILEGVLK